MKKNKMKMLFVLPFMPGKNSDQAGHRLAFSNIFDAAIGAEVSLFVILTKAELPSDDLKNLCLGGIHIHRISRLDFIFNCIFQFPSIYFRFLTRASKRIFKSLRHVVDAARYDEIRFEFSQTLFYSSYLRRTLGDRCPVLNLSVHDLQFQLVLRRKIEGLLSKWVWLTERMLLNSADVITVLSEKDKVFVNYLLDVPRRVKVEAPKINVLFDAIKVRRGNVVAQPNTILYWGAMNRVENEDAVVHFYQTTLIRLHENGYFFKLLVVGSRPSERLKALASKLITVTGFVDDPSDYFLQASIAVIPLRLGAGVKIKTLELKASGIPLILSTPIGAEGVGGEEASLHVIGLENFYEELRSRYVTVQ